MNKTNQIPYTWEEIETEVREAILCLVSMAEITGRTFPNVTGQSLGLEDPDDKLHDPTQTLEEAELARIPLEEFGLHRLARHAYLYAYQLDGADSATSEDAYEIACGVLSGFPATDQHGNPSPLAEWRDAPLRRMFETFQARWNLNEDIHGLTVRELALLSSMTVPAARTSLSKEGFKLVFPISGADTKGREDDRAATLNTTDARLWLSRRRGFIPNRKGVRAEGDDMALTLFQSEDNPLPQIIQRLLLLKNIDLSGASTRCGKGENWLADLVEGKETEIDIGALRALAHLLSVPEAPFVARAVQYLIEGESAVI